MNSVNLYIYFMVSLSNFCTIYSNFVSVFDKRDIYQTTRYDLKLPPNKSEDLMSAFSAWTIMSRHFRDGKVILPVLNTPRSENNHRWRLAIGDGRPKIERKDGTTRKVYVKREDNYTPRTEKNYFTDQLAKPKKIKVRNDISLRDFIRQLGNVFSYNKQHYK